MPVVQAPSFDRPLFFGASALAKSHGVRSRSCGSIQRPLTKQNPLETQPCSPSGRLLTPMKSRIPLATQRNAADLWDTSPLSHAGKGILGKSSRYLAPLSPESFRSSQSTMASTCHVDWPSKSQALESKYDSQLVESLSEWRPKVPSKKALVAKAALNLTRKACMTIPRSLGLLRPALKPGSVDLEWLNWSRQVNDRVAGPSGMLLRVERLRQAVIKMQAELLKNRCSLQAVRQSFQQTRPEDDRSQRQMLALPSSPAPAKPSKTRKGQGISITCDISEPIFTAELTDILNREDVTV